MSWGAARHRRSERRWCWVCGVKPALYSTPANPKARRRKDHDCCEDCWQKLKREPSQRRPCKGG